MSKKQNKSIQGEHRKKIAQLIDFIGQRHNRWTVFSDFLAMAALSLANNSNPYGASLNQTLYEERETRYLEIINKYDRRDQKFFTLMFAELVEELEIHSEHLVDVLGELFHELHFNDAWKGQFFTPMHVCDMAGEMAIDSTAIKKAVDDKGYISICEPCCGAGAMIYGAVNAIQKAGFNRSNDILVVANDIDERCVFMTYIQCSLYGIPAIVQQKDSLTDKVFGEPFLTLTYLMQRWKWTAFLKGANKNDESAI